MTHKRPTEFDRTLGERVRLYRIKQGLSQKQLASRLQISFQQVQKYEKGDNRISSERLCRLAQELHVTIEALVGKPDAHERQRPALGGIDQQLVERFGAISTPSTRKLVLQLVALLSAVPSAESTGLP